MYTYCVFKKTLMRSKLPNNPLICIAYFFTKVKKKIKMRVISNICAGGARLGSWKGDNYPVENVSWNDAREFIRKLNARSSAKFRLPSEAQWEYACRAGGKSVTVGTRSGGLKSSSARYYSRDGTAPVGSYDPNALGLHDMSGNVYEWVQDNRTSYGNVGTNNPIFEASGAYRVDRGGSWSHGPRHLRCSNRDSFTPSYRLYYLGFRLLRR